MTTPTPVDAGPTCVSRQIVVDAPCEDVFALLADPHRHHEVDGSGTVKPEVIGPHRLEYGDRFRVSMRMKGVPYAITSTVTRLEPGRVVEWRHPGGHRWRWELSPVGESATQVTEVFDYRGTRLPWLMALLGFPRRNAAGIERTLAALEARFGA